MNADERTDIAALRELLDMAAPQPWVVEHARIWSGEPNPNKNELLIFRGSRDWAPDAALIVAAVNALPTLLDELDAARATIERVTALADDYHDEYVNAMTDVQSLQEGSRERAEWMANAHRAAEQRDELRAALAPAHDATEASQNPVIPSGKSPFTGRYK